MTLMKTLASCLIACGCIAAALPASAADPACLKAPGTIGFLPKMDTDPYFHVARQGALEAQKEIGGKLIQQAPSTATADAQIEFVNALVAQKVDVLVISSTDANALAPALRRARAQGVRVMTYDSDATKEARTLFINQARSDSLALQMLDSMGTLIGYSGEFAILSSTPTATNQNTWISVMKAQLANNPKFAQMKLVQVAYGEESEQINQQQALALAEAFPNLKGILVPAGIGLPAAARALEQSGGIQKIKLTGVAPATFMKKYIEAGSAQDIWWNVSDLGYLAYHAAQQLAQCKITGKKGESFAAGRLGNYTILDNGEIVLGEAEIVTPKNLQKFKF
ncbi:rhamnose ABC transporter substrate-binding protein [Variovorax sp.]|jgi:rhamnose transport system substrate-binding protein|uniref:rhamnose ABC transporter substrate-binding protein n=1 Tax=Variovorax sp. TaxID=1871043 RepID=UPI0037D9B00E